jgi:hypothetical protein
MLSRSSLENSWYNNIRVKAELLMIKDIGDYNFESL